MLSRWKREAEENLYTLFKNDSAQKRREQREHEAEMSELYAKIGGLATHVEWLKKNLVSNSTPRGLREMVEQGGSLPIKTRAALLGVSRSSIYRKPTPPSPAEFALREEIDRTYTAHPEFGTRRMCVWLGRTH